MKLLDIIRQYLPGLKKAYFWSDGSSSQFHLYPFDLRLSWDYGEVHHFKGPKDGTGGTVKRRLYQDVSSSKVIIKDA